MPNATPARALRATALALAVGAMPIAAHATLGQKLNTTAPVAASGQHAAVSLRPSQSTPGVTVQTSLLNGVQVTQYANSAGVVFAVAWSGPAQPDLQSLLGANAAALRHPDLARSTLGRGVFRQHDLRIETFGRLRDVHGQAYIPSLTPAGFKF